MGLKTETEFQSFVLTQKDYLLATGYDFQEFYLYLGSHLPASLLLADSAAMSMVFLSEFLFLALEYPEFQ